jgi:periplasmic divalent cation tolerance protein
MTAARDQPIAVFITAPDKEEASRLADLLIERNLAACVQVLPAIESIYRWQGKIERQSEVLLIAKTLSAKFAELERAVSAVHSYETPEIVAVALTELSDPYRQWLSANVTAE